MRYLISKIGIFYTSVSFVSLVFVPNAFAQSIFAEDVSAQGIPARSVSAQKVTVQSEELETITVVAEPEPGTGDVQPGEHTASHQSIGKQELERQDINLGDILANETGVQFRQIGGLGALTTVTLRGASAQQTSVFLDGVLLNSAGNSSVDFSLLELLNLASVDVYRGAAPVQLSQGNIGGAVNLRSLGAVGDKPNTKMSITGGSFNTNRFQFAHHSSHRQWDVVAAASREHSNNTFTFNNDNATPLNPNDDSREARNNAQTTKLNALSRVGLQWSPNIRSDFMVQATGRDLGIPEWLNNEQNVASYNTDAVELQLVNRFDGIGNWNTALSLFQHYQDNHYLDALGQVGLGSQDTISDTQTTGVKTYWEHIDDQGTLSLTASLRRESLRSEDALAQNQNYRTKRQTLLSSAQYALFLNGDRLLVTPAIRLQTVNDNYAGISRLNANQRRDTAFTPQLGLRFTHSDTFSIRTNVGQFVREPSFSELFGSRGLIVGNNNLRPEEGTNADIGFTWSPNKLYQLNTSVFGSWRDELIVIAFDARGIGRSVNTGKANVFGIEIGNTWTINKRLTARLNTTYQSTHNFDANRALNNKEIPGEARLSAHLKLQYKIGKVRTWMETNHKSDFFYDQANLLPARGYWLHNAGVTFDWNKFQFSLTANNIGNVNVEDFNGFARPGRAYFFSLTYRL